MIQSINQLATNANNKIRLHSVQMPTKDRNYCLFNQTEVDYYVSQKEQALPYIKNVLQISHDEKEIAEALYITDKLIDNGTKGIPAMYPILAKYNNTKSPSIQSLLAGIYRKTQVPDAFGPLISMLIKNSMNGYKDANMQICEEESSRFVSFFDPNEEIGGAILEYIRNYSNNPKTIDYTA